MAFTVQTLPDKLFPGFIHPGQGGAWFDAHTGIQNCFLYLMLDYRNERISWALREDNAMVADLPDMGVTAFAVPFLATREVIEAAVSRMRDDFAEYAQHAVSHEHSKLLWANMLAGELSERCRAPMDVVFNVRQLRQYRELLISEGANVDAIAQDIKRFHERQYLLVDYLQDTDNLSDELQLWRTYLLWGGEDLQSVDSLWAKEHSPH